MALHARAMLYARRVPLACKEVAVEAFKAGYALATQENPLSKQCIGCYRLFEPKAGNQQYCTRKCGNRTRIREWRIKHGLAATPKGSR